MVSALVVGLGMKGQSVILDDEFRSGSIPVGWTQTDVTFQTSADGYAKFSSNASILTSPTIDLSAYSNVQLKFDVAKFGSGNDGPIIVQVSDDDGANWTSQTFTSPTPDNWDYVQSGPTAITASSTTVKFRFLRTSSASAKRFRDLVLTGELLTMSSTSIQFESSTQSSSENAGSYDICVGIENPSETAATFIQVVSTNSLSPHLSGYTTQTLTFPAGSSTSQCVTLNITDDETCLNGADYTFELQMVSGGDMAAIGTNITTTLTITDDDGSFGTIVKQGFEEDATETFTYTSTNGEISTLNTGIPSGQRIRSGSRSFQSRGSSSGSITSTLNFDAVDISTFTDVELEIWNSSISENTGNGADGTDNISVFVSQTASFSTPPNIRLNGNNNARYGMDGTGVVSTIAPATTLESASSGGNLSGNDAKSKLQIKIPDSWNTLFVRIALTNNNTNEIWCIDDIRLRGSACAACVNPVVSDFNPKSGPKETEVSVTGTGFITGGAITDVLFGNSSASSFTIISNTELVATVPADAATGKIAVDRSGCVGLSAQDFMFLKEDCDVGDASLILSELCDPDNAAFTDRYIEFFNPTNQTIDLTGWSVSSISNGNVSTQCFTWTLSGVIAPGEAKTCGYTNPVNGGPHDFTDPDWYREMDPTTATQCYFDWNGQGRDGAALYNGTERVDAFLLNASSGTNLYENSSLIRNNTICEPNSDSPLSDWTITAVSDAGSGASTPGTHSSCAVNTNNNSIAVDTPPLDINEPICHQPQITLSASSAETISYQWYVNQGNSNWTLVTNGANFAGASTNILSILNFTAFDGAQFYCEMETATTCINYSKAIQLKVLPNDKIYFRSVASGLWNSTTVWQFSDDLVNYENACVYPTVRNAELIEINAATTVTYNLQDTDTMPTISVLNGGTLQTTTTEFLQFTDMGAGAEFFVEGIYTDNGTSGNSISFLNGATWQLESDGTIIKTNTSSVNNYSNPNYEGGMSTIPAAGTWIYRKNSSAEVSVGTVGFYYPNLIFENNTNIPYSPTFTTYTFSGSTGGTAIVKGDLDVGGSGIGFYHIRNNNFNGVPIRIDGDLIVRAGSELSNLGTVAGTGFDVKGDLVIDGILNLSNGSTNGGQLTLSGTTDQLAIGGTTVLARRLTIYKSSGNILADLSFDIDESLTMTAGILELDDESNFVNLKTTATTTGASNSSFVDGRVRKSAATGANFSFPIGDQSALGDFYQPARIFGNAAATTIDAQYFAEAHPNAGAYYDGQSNSPGDNQEIGNCDFWSVNKVSGANAQIGFAYTNIDANYCNEIGTGGTDFLQLARYASSTWEYPIIEGVDVTTVAGEISSIPPMATYGDFALASNRLELNVLPIELLFFQASANGKAVHTSWVTSSETDNDFFTIERSANAADFYPIGTLNGAGNSQTELNYAYADDAPLLGISYYRLKQTDFDGGFTYSDIRSVAFEHGGNFKLIQAYKTGSALNLVYEANAPSVTVKIFDVLGKRVYSDLLENYGGRAAIHPNLSRGAYVVRISDGKVTDALKVVL